MSARRLDVLINEQKVGTLRESDDLWEFEYAPAWIASPLGFDLSPALARTESGLAGQGVHRDGATQRPVQWYFDNLLPEEALRTIVAQEVDLPAEDAFGLLAYFGSESAGSLVLRDPLTPTPAEHGLKPLDLADLSRRIDRLPQVSLSHDAPKRMSLAGAQHKMLVVSSAGKLFEPLAGTPSTHILKPDHAGGDYPSSVANEYFGMRLARDVGLDVPAVQRLYVPQPVYIVERFDRRLVAGAEEAERRHAIDTCQLLNKARSFKYSAARLESLVEAIGFCRNKAVTRLRLYRWLIFNLLIGNSDNHLKNISFLVDASGIGIAPGYDMLSTAVYDTRAFANERARWPATSLAFAIGDAQTFAGVTRAHVLAAGRALGLATTTATRELDRLLRAVPEQAAKLVVEIEASSEREVAACPDPSAARMHIASELRVIRAARYIVVADMCRQLS